MTSAPIPHVLVLAAGAGSRFGAPKQLARLHAQRQSIDEAIKELSTVMVTVRQKVSELSMVPAGSAS